MDLKRVQFYRIILSCNSEILLHFRQVKFGEKLIYLSGLRFYLLSPLSRLFDNFIVTIVILDKVFWRLLLVIDDLFEFLFWRNLGKYFIDGNILVLEILVEWKRGYGQLLNLSENQILFIDHFLVQLRYWLNVRLHVNDYFNRIFLLRKNWCEQQQLIIEVRQLNRLRKLKYKKLLKKEQ